MGSTTLRERGKGRYQLAGTDDDRFFIIDTQPNGTDLDTMYLHKDGKWESKAVRITGPKISDCEESGYWKRFDICLRFFKIHCSPITVAQIRRKVKKVDAWETPDGEEIPRVYWDLRQEIKESLQELLQTDALETCNKKTLVEIIGWAASYQPCSPHVILKKLRDIGKTNE